MKKTKLLLITSMLFFIAGAVNLIANISDKTSYMLHIGISCLALGIFYLLLYIKKKKK